MTMRSTIGVILLVSLPVAGCSFFEVADHSMSDGPGDQGAAAHSDMPDHGDDTPPIEGAPETRITADAMSFEPGSLEFGAGEQRNLTLISIDILHDLTVDEMDFHVAADAGEEVTGGLVFNEPGTYLAYCAVPGHRQAGMELEITVR